MFPEVLSPSQQDLKSWHDKLSHLHPKSIFILAKLGVLPKLFLDLKDFVLLCASCMFGTARRLQTITKSNKSGSILKYTDNKPITGVSVDISAMISTTILRQNHHCAHLGNPSHGVLF